MIPEHSDMLDMIAVGTAQIDQSQSLIDEGRLKYSNSPNVQRELDKNQTSVDNLRNHVEMLKIKTKDTTK